MAGWLAALGVIFGAGYRWIIRPIRKLVDDVSDMKKELHPNGGSSLKDQATRTEMKVDRALKEQKRVRKALKNS